MNIWILIVTFNHEKYIGSLLSSVLRQSHPSFRVLVIDNGSTDGTVALLKSFEQVQLVQNFSNNGFCGGNNQGMAEAFRQGADACLLLNPDTVVPPNLLTVLEAEFLELKSANDNVGLLQPQLVQMADPSRINTIGNAIHYLGFSWCADNGKAVAQQSGRQFISGVSGACMLVSRPFYESVGDFNSLFFAYAEDEDLSWRGMLLGLQNYCCFSVSVLHDYQFSKSNQKWYHAEKNRLMVLLQNLEKKTLLLLIPALIIVETCILLFSILKGFFIEKIKGYRFIISHWKLIMQTRRAIQARRLVSDHQLWPRFAAAFSFSEIDHMLIRKVLNPFLRWYYRLLK